MIERAHGSNKKLFLTLSLIANIGVLAFFKYYNFFIENVNSLLDQTGLGLDFSFSLLHIILPIGLSFHTFQAMSYTIEVYRGNQKAEKHFGIYALYVMFWPQLVAGPIERPQNILHQFHEKKSFSYENLVKGLRIMLWGFFIKLVIADRLALYVNAVYNNVNEHSGITIFIATVFFAFQIYCDFAGYSYIAIGGARVMGFKLMTNFNRPYFAKSIDEFWKRWHISLSTWFKDYLYIPLGGNRVGIPRWFFNLLFVFLLSGFWHGASWTFIIWGGLNGIYLIFGILKKKANLENILGEKLSQNRIVNSLRMLVTFLLICFSWIFFRANSVSDAFLGIKKIISLHGPLFTSSDPALVPYCLFAIASLLIIEYKDEYYVDKFSFFDNRSIIVRFTSYIFTILLILMLGVFDGSQFIYFQF